MLFMDMPAVPPQYTPVIVAQASQAKQEGAERAIGICHPVENKEESRLSAVNGVSPILSAFAYLRDVEHRKIEESVLAAAKMTLLQAPKHGELMLWDSTQTGRFLSGDYSYEGSDSATVLVEVAGYKVKVIYHFVLMHGVPGSGEEGTATDDKSICPKGYMWKISSTLDADGNSVIASVDYLPTDPSTNDTALTSDSLSSWLSLAQLDGKIADLSGINVSVADLPNAAVGQTTGANITLDTNAAGNGWFIDSTPDDNSEFLPTSNPNEWVAKEGSDAYGKMDMLSVLLHEYGHALGIEHSADSGDYMAATLTPGVRRLPSAEELALMQQLVGQVKEGMVATSDVDSIIAPSLALPQGERGRDIPLPLDLPLGGSGFLAFLARRKDDSSDALSPSLSPAGSGEGSVRYEVAANPTLAMLDTPTGWNTIGSVDITNGAATLREISATQTRLSQVFTVSDKDRYLSFTSPEQRSMTSTVRRMTPLKSRCSTPTTAAPC